MRRRVLGAAVELATTQALKVRARELVHVSIVDLAHGIELAQLGHEAALDGARREPGAQRAVVEQLLRLQAQTEEYVPALADVHANVAHLVHQRHELAPLATTTVVIGVLVVVTVLLERRSHGSA